MKQRSIRWYTALAVCAVVGAGQPRVLRAQQPGVFTLAEKEPTERSIGRREEHRYAFGLTAGEYARIVVEQRGINLTIEVRSHDGSVIADYDDEITPIGREQVDVVADKAGSYSLVIKPSSGMLEPGSYVIKVGDRHPASAGERSLEEARKLSAAARRLDDQGQFFQAKPLYERALKIIEDVCGPDDLHVATVAARLGSVYLHLPDNMKAEASYQRAIAIMDRTLGPQHPRTAYVRSRLAVMYEHTGQGPKAETLLRQAMDVIEKALGQDNSVYVSCLVTLGNLRNDAGDLDESEKIIRRAMAITEKIEEADGLNYGGLLNNLGELYRQKGDYLRAEEFLTRALGIGERVRGPDTYWVATTLQNLGIVARERKDYETAEAYYQRSLELRTRLLGPYHPDVAQLLNNLAALYRATGDNERSIQTHFRALRIWEEAFGPYQRGTLVSVGNIARTYAAMGDIPNAIVFQRRVDAIIERQMALNLAIGSERQKLAFVRGIAERTDRTISLHLVEAPKDVDAASLAATVLLQRKGRVLDAMTDTFAAVRQRVPSRSDQELLDQLKGITGQLARLALNTADPPDAEERQKLNRDLQGRKEQLEAALSERSDEFRVRMQTVTLEAVQGALPADAALLEFAIFRPFDPRAERNAEAYGPAHYAAYVVRRNAPPFGWDLGPAAAIDESIDFFRQTLRDRTRRDLKFRARAIDELVMRPLRAAVGDATRLLVSPDGDLNLVPFDALIDEQGHYLIERYAMNYVTSGRDLLRLQVVRGNQSRPVIFADPLFGEPAPNAKHGAPPAAGDGTTGRSITTGASLSNVYFAPLAASADEARAIKNLFPDATLFTGTKATKTTLQRVEAPRMLHIASHGFFLQDARETPSSNVGVDNPLLRSGLALAGANLTNDTHEGILTALEASGLNLWGTKLVTLSGCDTGVGEIRNGEGVYGLRRAFVLAGTESVVMSLWPVSDAIAREMMVSYYTGLRAGLGRGDALREAKLEMLKRGGRDHPFYWASFIQSGEWANLDGVR
ncbi:MAG TPA: CHAT domain-containing protein [Vicinamibacterales bacterium]